MYPYTTVGEEFYPQFLSGDEISSENLMPGIVL
jgi:hypothetical protein